MTARQSSTYPEMVAKRAVDWQERTAACTGYDNTSMTTPWWSVDLGEQVSVGYVTIVSNNHALGPYCIADNIEQNSFYILKMAI